MLGAPLAACAQPSEPTIIPRPVSMTMGEGQFTLARNTVILAPAAQRAQALMLAGYLRPATGYQLRIQTARREGGVAIELRLAPELSDSLGSEGYRLVSAAAGVVVTAATPRGLFYGMQTLRQLFPPQVLGGRRVAGVAWTIPAVDIMDYPRFSWRGMHLDVARHFMPKEFVKRYIDLLAMHKMNTFHWHLTEDQGWRIAINRYPRLTSVGAWRKESIVGRPDRDSTRDVYDGRRHGGFYTQKDIREVVAYAAARFVNVVPEIEMPGHAQAAIAAYPELGVIGRPVGVWTRWGVSETILNPEESTVRFMQNVLDEVLALFPSPFIHIGGDEAVKKQWEESPRVQARMRELGVKDAHELQSWFVRRMDEHLTQKGRRLVGWDEILEGGLAPGATVMSWRGVKGAIEAARSGHDVVMSPTTHLYFDYYQSRDTTAEPLTIGGFLPLDSVYSYEPVPAELTPTEARRVLGAQANVWTEYMKTPRQVEYMAYPRAVALAEVVWTPRQLRNRADFRRRLDVHLRRLDALGVNYRKP